MISKSCHILRTFLIHFWIHLPCIHCSIKVNLSHTSYMMKYLLLLCSLQMHIIRWLHP